MEFNFEPIQSSHPEKFSDNILDNLDEGVTVLNAQGDFIYCNSTQQHFIGFGMIGHNAYQLKRDGVIDLLLLELTLERKKPVSEIQHVINATGEIHPYYTTQVPIFDENGEILYLINFTRDLKLIQTYLEAEVHSSVFRTSADNNATKNIIFQSEKMHCLLKKIDQVASTNATVLLSGETGTGKDVLAAYIHNQSNRKNSPLVKINCAALPENLLESELFGYEKGAFTGSSPTGKAGLIEAADNGTLFLNEINSMPLLLQSKLLTVLETHTILRVGAIKPKRVDFRLVAATNEDIEELVRKKQFRADLYYRLNVIHMVIPPLRERLEDVSLLVDYYLKLYCETYNRKKVFSPAVIGEFLKYDWPGNIRELRNLVERIILTSDANIVEIKSLPEGIIGDISPTHSGSFTQEPLADHRAYNQGLPLSDNLEAFERQIIIDTMKKSSSITKAAYALGVNQSTLSRKIAKYNLKYNYNEE